MEPSTSTAWKLSNFQSNGRSRKRKATESDLDEKINQKMFVTEDKMVKEMQTLSLELAALKNTNGIPKSTSPIQEKSIADDIESDEEDSSDEKESYIEFHKLLKDSLKNDDLQDSLISKLCENERRKLTMQIVPFMPIHPAQLTNENVTTEDKTKNEEEIIENQPVVSDEFQNENNKHLFKIPSVPTPYTVEEPGDSSIKRGSTMKRSYSQSDQYNTSLSVTELKSDGNDHASIDQSQSAYFIVEPTGISLSQAKSSSSGSSISLDGPSIQITEFIENATSNNEFTSTLDDDDIDMQSVATSDAGDKMDDD
jgi:hypothetical protein